MLALASRSARAIASPTSSGTCDPRGASRKAKPPCRDENRLRAACTSSTVALMERAYLGGTGTRISRVILGCGNFGGIGSAPAFFGGGESREDAFAIMDAAREAGITTFDTADADGGGGRGAGRLPRRVPGGGRRGRRGGWVGGPGARKEGPGGGGGARPAPTTR